MVAVLIFCLGLFQFGCGGNQDGQQKDESEKFRQFRVSDKEAVYIVDQEIPQENVQTFLTDKARIYDYVYILDNDAYVDSGYTVGAAIKGEITVVDKDWSKRPTDEQVKMWAEYKAAKSASFDNFDLDKLYGELKEKYNIQSPDDFAAQIDTVYNWLNNAEKLDMGVRTYEEIKKGY